MERGWGKVAARGAGVVGERANRGGDRLNDGGGNGAGRAAERRHDDAIARGGAGVERRLQRQAMFGEGQRAQRAAVLSVCPPPAALGG